MGSLITLKTKTITKGLFLFALCSLVVFVVFFCMHKDDMECPGTSSHHVKLISGLMGPHYNLVSNETHPDYPPLSHHTNYSRDKFTIVMPTYGRSAQLPKILTHYCGVSNVAKILVLWNNIGVPVPGPIKDFECKVPLQIKIMEENKLTSRFVLYPEIETEAIFAVDDDRMVSHLGMKKGFAAWKTFHHLIVGFSMRHFGILENGQYKYCKEIDSYSMMLTNSAFIHRMYLKMFTESLPPSIHAFIDENMNGEDIAMNAMVADYLKKIDRPQCPCLWVKASTEEVHMKDKGQFVSLYGRGDHVKKRDQCLNLIASEYKYMPLMPCKYVV